MKKTHYILDKPVKKIYSLNQMRVGDTLSGVPLASYYKNKKWNEFIKLDLDYGHAICHIYFLVFDFPIQKVLPSYIYNSFELVKFYRQSNNIPVDDEITQLHDIDWQEIIDWLNQTELLKIQVVSRNINGFKNIRFIQPKN